VHLLSLPRHRMETTLSDYARIFASLADPLLRRAPSRPSDSIADFEREFADYLGCRHAIAVSSGRLGLHLILDGIGLAPGDEAIVPAFNLFAVVERFCQLGLIPRFCDVRRGDLNIDAAAVERSIGPRTKVLLATHMFGHPAEMDRLVDWAGRHQVILLEDCAHALGSKYGERFVGTFGKAAIFSFSVLKLVTTFGGGMIATNDDELAATIRRRLTSLQLQRGRTLGLKKAVTGALMDLGTRRLPFSFGAWPLLRILRAVRPDVQRRMMTETPHADREFRPQRAPGFHPFQARLGRSQLRRVEQFIDRRRRVGQWLHEELTGIDEVTLLQPSATSAKGTFGRHNGLYYGILVDRPEELSCYLFRRGIDSETSEYLNCADLEMYRGFYTDCPVAREVQSRILRLPNYPDLSPRDVRRIGRTIREFYARPRVANA